MPSCRSPSLKTYESSLGGWPALPLLATLNSASNLPKRVMVPLGVILGGGSSGGDVSTGTGGGMGSSPNMFRETMLAYGFFGGAAALARAPGGGRGGRRGETVR